MKTTLNNYIQATETAIERIGLKIIRKETIRASDLNDLARLTGRLSVLKEIVDVPPERWESTCKYGMKCPILSTPVGAGTIMDAAILETWTDILEGRIIPDVLVQDLMADL